jgi:hypothetical protein
MCTVMEAWKAFWYWLARSVDALLLALLSIPDTDIQHL